MLSEEVSSKTLKERVDYILENGTLKQLIENRNRYDTELSLETNLHLFDEDWIFVEKKVEGLVAEYEYVLNRAKINRDKEKNRSYNKGYFVGLVTAYETFLLMLKGTIKQKLEAQKDK